MRTRNVSVILFVILAGMAAASAATLQSARVKDLTTIEGVRDNPLIGYGLVVGLNGTGDRQQTVFSTQTLANMLLRMGVQVSATSVRVNNIGFSYFQQFSNPSNRCAIHLSCTLNQIRLETFLPCALIQLQIGIFRVGEDCYCKTVRPISQCAREIQNHGLRAVHSATANNVQNPHSAPFLP